MMAIVTFNPDFFFIDSYRVKYIIMLKDFYSNDSLEHKVYKPVKISYPSCLGLFTSYFCETASF